MREILIDMGKFVGKLFLASIACFILAALWVHFVEHGHVLTNGAF